MSDHDDFMSDGNEGDDEMDWWADRGVGSSFVEAEESSATCASTPERDTHYESPDAKLSTTDTYSELSELSSVGAVYCTSSVASDFSNDGEGK